MTGRDLTPLRPVRLLRLLAWPLTVMVAGMAAFVAVYAQLGGFIG